MNNSSHLEDQDPDYAAPGPSTSYQQKIYEETARTNASRKITSIIDREFSLEIDAKEKEILEIQEKLDKALKTLHFLRYVIISDYYNRKQCLANPPEDTKQLRLHPAVKSVIGKSPKTSLTSDLPEISPDSAKNHHNPQNSPGPQNSSHFPPNLPQNSPQNSLDSSQKFASTATSLGSSKKSPEKTELPSEPPRKIPRYVPPKNSKPEPQSPSRGVRHKIRKRIVVGNISKWIPPDWREDAASHKWTMYVRSSKEETEISEFVSKVRFFLHPSYRPNDIVDVTSSPFHLSRRGWGEFPLRVQLHFKNSSNKPMDIIHHLKLDRTYTGLQTLGSETIVDIWISTLSEITEKSASSDCKLTVSDRIRTAIKQESNTYAESPNPPEFFDGIKIKEERIDDDEVRILSHVHFEHDYVNFGVPQEANVTISHSPSKDHVQLTSDDENLRNADQSHSPIARPLADSHFDVQSRQDATQNGGSIENGDFVLKKSLSVKALSKMCENGSSLLQPLKINIPASFEALKLQKKPDKQPVKQIIVLKDNKEQIIHLDVNSTRKIVSVLKKPKSLLNLKLDPSKSLILNSTSNIPALKFAEPSEIQKNAKNEKINGKILKTRVTIGKDKTKLGSKRELYEKIIESLETTKVTGDVAAILRYIVRRIPLISEYSGDPEYRRLHPYVCASDEEFLSFNVGKQRALEWYRAKEMRNLLRKRGIPGEKIWTVKEIMVWCRLHGFTPIRRGLTDEGASKSEKSVDVGNGAREFNTCTEPVEFLEWLQEGRTNENHWEDGDEEVVDVVGDGEGEVKRESGAWEVRESLATLEVPKAALPIYSYVCNTSRQIGVKLEAEEVVPGVVHGAAGRVLAKAVECLLEDLLRSSLAQSFGRAGNGSFPETITLDDVQLAIVNREEFDVFTNNGIGTQNGD